MNPTKGWGAVLLLGLSALARPAMGSALSVELWTDRGRDAVYQPGDAMAIDARVSHDAYLLIYEIDAEGYVHVLFPDPRDGGMVEGGSKIRLPASDSDLDLVVQGPVGQGYVVAIASAEPFLDLPWYLRSRDGQAEEIGYHGRPDDEEDGVTAEGRIVGDPFVGMERIRRRVLEDPEDSYSFATAYTTYFVHHEVRYPRYICYDCHRSGQWAWWDGFDPYYTRCSVFDFRVNWSWGWGPRYWYGFVPYYVYVYRSDCPPRYRRSYSSGLWHSSWDGRRRWNDLWGSNLKRRRSAPPVGYVPPSKFDEKRSRRGSKDLPPGFLSGGNAAGRSREPRTITAGRGREVRSGRDGPGAYDPPSARGRELGRSRRSEPRRDGREPARREPRRDYGGQQGGSGSNERPRVGRTLWIEPRGVPVRPNDDSPRAPRGSGRWIEPRGVPQDNSPRREVRPEPMVRPPQGMDRPPRQETPRVDRPHREPREAPAPRRVEEPAPRREMRSSEPERSRFDPEPRGARRRGG